jgi:Glycosyl transferases group 1
MSIAPFLKAGVRLLPDSTCKFRAVFVTNRRHLGDGAGGVQTCSREYLAVLEAAGLSVEVVEVDTERRLSTRLARVFSSSPYTGSIAQHDLKRVADAAEGADWVFLNQVNLASGLRRLARRETVLRKTVLLSHGAEVTDLLHLIRARQTLPLSGRLRPTPRMALHKVLADEISARAGIEAAVCLSPFDADFERWLGVRRVTWIARTVTSAPLDWQPVDARFGFLGTLDHAPNLEGLVQVLDVLDRSGPADIEVRVVGGPEPLGRWLAQRFPQVRYCGALDEPALRQEASSWTAFLNPIFCQARGCSTKLATALAWQIPIVTTPVGRRGYVHREGSIPVAEDPAGFVALMQSLRDRAAGEASRFMTQQAAASTPTIADNARIFRDFLGLPPAGTAP